METNIGNSVDELICNYKGKFRENKSEKKKISTQAAKLLSVKDFDH